MVIFQGQGVRGGGGGGGNSDLKLRDDQTNGGKNQNPQKNPWSKT